ncbi:MAG: hypothetical protein D6B25_01795 [Desulfobulbaceae bacterium]|nr:MAG: hypothetical protein D6B25_01795 [Desulfobulbaceae bacterium]
MIYIVLGMHKSGTTLVSEILHKSGIQMIGEDNGDPDYDTGNKYERISTASLNKDLLDCWDIYSLDILPKDTSENAVAINFKAKAEKIIADNQNDNGHWGFKDPRTCLTYPQWQKYLPEHRLVVVFRHPAQVMKHYEKRNLRRKKPHILLKSLQAWTVYNRQVLEILKLTACDHIVVNFEKFMSEDHELDRLEKFVGNKLHDARDLKKFKMKNLEYFYLKPVDYVNRSFAGLESYKQILDDYSVYQKQHR